MPTGGSYFDISSITGKQGAETSYSVVIEKSSSLLPVEVVTTSTLPTRATSPAVSTFVGSFSSKITNSSKEKNTDQSIGTNTSSILKITTHTFTSTGFNTLTPDTTGVTSINSVVSSVDFNGNPSVNDLDGSSFAIFTEFNSISVHSATSGLSSNVTTIKPIDLVRGGETESSTITGHSNSASVVTMTKTVTEITTYYIHGTLSTPDDARMISQSQFDTRVISNIETVTRTITTENTIYPDAAIDESSTRATVSTTARNDDEAGLTTITASSDGGEVTYYSGSTYILTRRETHEFESTIYSESITAIPIVRSITTDGMISVTSTSTVSTESVPINVFVVTTVVTKLTTYCPENNKTVFVSSTPASSATTTVKLADPKTTTTNNNGGITTLTTTVANNSDSGRINAKTTSASTSSSIVQIEYSNDSASRRVDSRLAFVASISLFFFL